MKERENEGMTEDTKVSKMYSIITGCHIKMRQTENILLAACTLAQD